MNTLACRVNEDGSIDHFSIWNRKLSKEELDSLYENDYNYHKFYRWSWQLFFLKDKNVYKVFKLFKPYIKCKNGFREMKINSPSIEDGWDVYLELPKKIN